MAITGQIREVDGDLVAYDDLGNEIGRIDFTNRRVTLHEAATLVAPDDIEGADIADDAVDSEHIAGGAVDPEHFAALAVTTPALGPGATKTVTVDVDCGAGGTGETDAVATIPANAVVTEVHVRCTEVFDGDTTQDFAVGVSGTADKYIASADFENGANDINAADEAFASALGTATAPVSVAAGESIIATWTNAGSASTGIVRVSVTYYTEDV